VGVVVGVRMCGCGARMVCVVVCVCEYVLVCVVVVHVLCELWWLVVVCVVQWDYMWVWFLCSMPWR